MRPEDLLRMRVDAGNVFNDLFNQIMNLEHTLGQSVTAMPVTEDQMNRQELLRIVAIVKRAKSAINMASIEIHQQKNINSGLVSH